MLLADKAALITGASRGIGKAIAERLAGEGASVVLLGRTDDVRSVADAIVARGSRAVAVQGDLADPATAKAAIAACRAQGGRLDVLVNNAGAMPLALLGMVQTEEARRLFDVNVVSMINLTQLAVRLMKGAGSVINLSSIARKGMAGGAVYSATKAAVDGFTRAAAKELAPRGIRVNAIAPGFIDTDMTAALTDAQRQATLGRIGMARPGTPQDVADVALFLASDLSRYVTGQVIGVDGGMQA